MSKGTMMVSGGFDPIHVGHTRLLRDACIQNPYYDLIVALNSDEWLIRKKGYYFMNWYDRAEILLSIQNVYDVVPVDDADDTVCEAIRRIKPDKFLNGGDRTPRNTPENDICAELKIEQQWGIGGDKIRSSSELVQRTSLEV